MTASSVVRDAPWLQRAATFVVFLVLGFSVGAWAAALPSLQAQLGLTNRGLSLALFAGAVGAVVTTVAAGMVAPRIGTGRATVLAAVGVVGLLSVPALAGSLALFVVFTFLMGLANGALDISMNGHASDIETRWGVPIMSSFHGAFSLGGLAGASLGGFLASLDWSAGAQLRTAAAAAALLLALALPMLGSGAKSQERVQALAWPERATLGLGIIALFGLIVEGAMADWSAIYLSSVTHSTKGVAATGYAAFALAMAAGRLAGDHLVAMVGRRTVVVGGGLVTVTGLALAVGFATPFAAAAGFALVGLGLANIVPVVFSAAAGYGASPAAGIATVATVGYAGFLSGPPIIGAIASFAGLRAGIAALLVAGAVIVLSGNLIGTKSRAGRE